MDYRRQGYKEGLANAHAYARVKAKLSQDYMSQEMGVNKKTIISWEKGLSSPDIDRSFEWFDICGINPLSQYLKVLWPDMDSAANSDNIEQSWDKLSNILPESIKRALLFIFTGEHGSSPDALIQMLLAYLHTPLAARATQAITTLNMYKLMRELDKDACPEGTQPDVTVLESAVHNARVEILRKTHYKE